MRWVGFLSLVAAVAAAAESPPRTAAEAEAVAPSEVWRRIPNLSMGLGAFFLEPREVTTIGGNSPFVIARPILVARAEKRFAADWLWEPQVSLLFPRTSRDGETTLAGFLNFDAGYEISRRWIVSAGLGLQTTTTFSSESDVELNGQFMTPGGSSLSWSFTNNAGVTFWVDPRFRVDAGTAVSQLLSETGRRFRYFLELGYAL